MEDNQLLSIIICTYNRQKLLKECLDALSSDLACGHQKCSVVVIDTSDDPGNQSANMSLVSAYGNPFYYSREAGGLSRARNRGAAIATTKYIGYLDDDSVVPRGFISRAFSMIKEDKYACFGGAIQSHWPFGKPRWLSSEYGNKPIMLDAPGLLNEGFLWGGNMFFQKEKLVAVGGFDEKAGMKGDLLGYGAENLVQIKFRQQGWNIGYDPNLMVYHAVLPHKHKLWWHVKSAYVTARDGYAVFPEQYRLHGIFKTFKNIPVFFVRGVFDLFSGHNYYPENLLLDILQPMARLAGKIIAIATK